MKLALVFFCIAAVVLVVSGTKLLFEGLRLL
jgi:hypothetical protein